MSENNDLKKIRDTIFRQFPLDAIYSDFEHLCNSIDPFSKLKPDQLEIIKKYKLSEQNPFHLTNILIYIFEEALLKKQNLMKAERK